MFVEKPISTSPVVDVWACNAFLKERKHIVSVGYMLRYLKCVQMMYVPCKWTDNQERNHCARKFDCNGSCVSIYCSIRQNRQDVLVG
jgi:hypothetical protein